MQVSFRRFRLASFAALASLLTGASGCQNAAAPPSASAPPAPAATTEGADATLEPAPEATPFPAGLASLVEPFKGDLDGMLKRRVIRVLTVQNPVLYFVDRGREIGMTYDALKAFEKQLNEKLGNKIVTVHVIAIPVARDELIPRLARGAGRHRRRRAHRHARPAEAGGLLAAVRVGRAGGAGDRGRPRRGRQHRRPLGQASCTSGSRAATPSTSAS